MSQVTDFPSELAAADRHDAAGEHSQAIDCLARATQAGSIEAMTRLAKRLVAGDRAPLLPTEGARFLADATRSGSAEAAANLAILLALGAYMPQNWDMAFNSLGLAAERGWEPARQQLAMLLPDHPLTREARRAGGGSSNLWRQIALEALRAEAHALQHSPVSSPWDGAAVYTVPHMVSTVMCEWMIEQSRGKLTRARVYDTTSGSDIVHPTRANTAAVFNLIDAQFVHVLVQWRMARTCGMPLSNVEPLTVLHYGTGEQVRDHYDFVDPKSPHYAEELAVRGQRRVTFLIYLNDDFTGGETDFPTLGIRFKGDRGTGLFFVNSGADDQPDLRMIHSGLPPSAGEKWIVSQFIRSRKTLE